MKVEHFFTILKKLFLNFKRLIIKKICYFKLQIKLFKTKFI